MPSDNLHTAPVTPVAWTSQSQSIQAITGVTAAPISTAAPTTYTEGSAQHTVPAQTQQEDHKIITLLTEQTALLRNMAAQPSLTELLTTQTQVLNNIMQQNQEILIALRSLAPINLLATPSLAPVPSPTTSTPIHPRSNTPSTPDNVETLTVSPPPTGKKRKTVVIKQSKPPDKSKGKN